MKIIQIVCAGRLIEAPLILTSNQSHQLQRLHIPVHIKKLMVEIALDDKNLPALIAAFRENNVTEDSMIGFRIADESLTDQALSFTVEADQLQATGEVVIVPFKVSRSNLHFDLDSLGLFTDSRGRLQVQRPSLQALKK